MIWRPPTGLPPTLLIHPLPMYLSFLPVPSCGSPAGPGAAVGAAAQPRWGFAPPGAFPGHLPWHKTCLHLICGPATKHTKKLGQVEKLPGAQCQVCHPCVSGPAAEYVMLTDLSCSARGTALRKASGRQAAKGKWSLFVLTSSDRESAWREQLSAPSLRVSFL